jgi:hypothetical protein
MIGGVGSSGPALFAVGWHAEYHSCSPANINDREFIRSAAT